MKTMRTAETIELSVVVPLYNEAGNVRPLHEKLVSVLEGLRKPYEIIFVDDGSRDETWEIARELTPLTLIRFRENFGQTAAFAAGIHVARGGIIITMDGDLENDPADVPSLLAKLNQGYDVVSGWREKRWKKKLFSRRIPSIIANKIISVITGVKLHDHGCMLKVYRASFLQNLYFIGDMHRMMAAHVANAGGRIAEVPVRFEERRYGTSKYGLTRAFKVVFDIISFYFFRKYRTRPMHFFGWMGFWSLLLGFLTFLWMLGLKFFEGTSFIVTPLPVLTVLFLIIGVQFVLMGLLAEILVRTQYEVERKPTYVIDSVLEL